MGENPFRKLPSVNEVLAVPALQTLAQDHAHDLIVAAVRTELTELRRRLGQGETVDGQANAQTVAARVAERLGKELRPKLLSVINATGILRDTNLGRATVGAVCVKA